MENRRAIKLADFMYEVRKHRKMLALLILAAFLLGAGLTLLSRCLDAAKKTSTITASFAVAAENSQGSYSSNNPEPQSQDYYLAEKMADAVMYVCTSDAVLGAVASNLGLPDGSVSVIRANLRISQYKKTQIVELSLNWPDPAEGIRILAELTQVAPHILVQTLGLGSVSVVNEAKASAAVGRWELQYPAVAVVLGLAAGFVYVLCSLCIHPRLVNPSDAPRLFGLETLAELPLAAAASRELSGSEKADSSDFYRSGIDGAARSILGRLSEGGGVLLITSAMPGEGKTEITVSLGARLAQLGKRVLLVDGNLQNPSLSKTAMSQAQCPQAGNGKDVPAEDAVLSLDAKLDVLPIHPMQGQMVKQLKENYDLVLIDAPAVSQADILQVSKMADRAIMVIRHDTVWVDIIQSSIARLRSADVALLGSIVNGINAYGSSLYRYCHGCNRQRQQEKP